MATNSLSSARAQARQDALSQLDSLGSNRSSFEFQDVFSTMENDAAAFIERVKANIQSADMPVTGKIEDLKLQVTETSINIIGEAYLIYQDKGVKGAKSSTLAPNSPFKYTDKMPPANVFEEYIKRKNINLRNEENYGGNPSPFDDMKGDDKAIKSASWAMAKKVYNEGFKPQDIFSKELPKLVEDLSKSVAGFTADLITSGITDRYGTDIYNKAMGR
ncbi:hypothetical protein FPZ42_07700 [Mucilaginibacter achroorhodeus]|uniref:Uncharacterized protein n=1 Tax=Mucilaginibacter achroorhodeus TaxID=2599294 RepID=A0A563U6D1_9SPHI|nr:hypothetical protein [Mucilaginibacter achroorhodeus]TWR26910.1 hypothetical protein FPZ42_07700 [Mucilaginibacter achroorhodeus]